MSTSFRILWLLGCLLIWQGGCARTGDVVDAPEMIPERLRSAWQADQHVVWEVDWPAAPLAGPVVVEAWQASARQRYEVLESATPTLIGETLVSDGQTAWLFNRFAGELTVVRADEARFSPLADALAIITARLAAEPQSVSAFKETTLPTGPTRYWRLVYGDGTTLDVWLNREYSLISQVRLAGEAANFTLLARVIEPLDEVPEGLFRINR